MSGSSELAEVSMMRLAQALLLAIAISGTAWAQHGAAGGHAGGGGFSAGRGFSMSSPGASRGFGGAPAFRPGVSSQAHRLYTPPPFGGTQPITGTGRRSPYPGGRHPYSYSRGVYLVPGFLNYGYGYGYGYADDSGYTDPQPPAAAYPDFAPAAPPDDGYPQQAYAEPPPRPAYQPPTAALADQPETTLVFKDGRASQQVQNYAVTRTTLYVLDGAKRREIPLDELDLPRTEKANRDAGLEFEVPAGAE